MASGDLFKAYYKRISFPLADRAHRDRLGRLIEFDVVRIPSKGR